MTFSDPKNDLSYRTIMYEKLKISPSEPLPKSHIIEVIAGILFGAQLAISEKFHFDATMDK
jgi:predicted membrane protein